MKIRPLLSITLLVALSGSGCSSTKTLQSEAPASALTIDGRVDDWGGALAPMEGERFSLGVRNDGEFLYVALLSRDEGVTRQIVRDGLILWFDPAGGKEKTFGLRFPLGLTALQPPGERSGGPRGGQQDPEAMRERFEASLADLQVLGADGKSRRVAVGSLPGVLLRARLDHGTLLYEMQLPLQRSEAFGEAVGVAPGAVVGLGFETPEADREALRGTMAGRGAPGGLGEMGGGRRGGMGGGMRGGQRPGGGRGAFAPAEPLKLWTRVELAK